MRDFGGRGVLILLVMIFVVCGSGLLARAVDPLFTADFFMRYYALFRSDAGPRIRGLNSPTWFPEFCREAHLPVDCNKERFSNDELRTILGVFDEARYNSLNGGVMSIALAAAREHLGLAFEIMEDLLRHYPGEFEFHNLVAIREEGARWRHLLTALPLIQSEEFEARGEMFTLRFRSDGTNHSITIENRQGRTIFVDGPRWVLHRNDPLRAELNTSMNKTWAQSNYRSYGLYQFALRYYLRTLGLSRINLYTENLETLEFIFRMKQLIYGPELRSQLLSIRPIRNYLETLGVNIQRFSEGHLTYLRMAENLLSYLSLQGRTRLSVGLNFRLNEENPALITSRRISSGEVERIKSAMRVLDEAVESELSSESLSAVRILPSSYIQRLQRQRARSRCSSLLTRRSA